MANARSIGRRWWVSGVTMAAALVAWGVLPVAATRAAAGVAAAAAGGSPATGVAVPALASYDRIVRGLMAKWEIPGGAVAVVRNGRLVLARGYGWADREARRPVEPESLFRIASLSKSLTAAAILQLSEAGRLRLDDRMMALLPDLAPPPGASGDARLGAITVRQLLQHTGGWDRERAFDPMFRSREIARAMGVASPPGAATIVRYMLRQPLQFTPGTRYAYSNFGYCVLGRIVERVSGMRYEDYVRERVLRPAGVLGMHLGRTLASERSPGEVRYYDFPGAGLAPTVFDRGVAGGGGGFGGGARVPRPYGGWSLEAMDAHGGWLASVVDMVRFVGAVDGRLGHPQVLGAPAIREMIARPAPPLAAAADTWYGMGWQVRPVGRDANWWHSGSLDGTTTLMVRAANGVTWAAFFNSRPRLAEDFGNQLDQAMWQAFDAVRQWPG